mgnify:CR=1 FL=1
MKQERKIIALDIGNVCVSIHPERVIARMNLFPTPEILAVSARLECGLITEREWLDFFHEKTGHRLNDDEMIDAWNLIIGDTLSGMPEAVRGALKQGYSFVYLSDVSRFHLTECRASILMTAPIISKPPANLAGTRFSSRVPLISSCRSKQPRRKSQGIGMPKA